MPRLTNTAPNRILAIEGVVVSEDPLIALLTFETDDGTFEFAINRAVADSLAETVKEITAEA